MEYFVERQLLPSNKILRRKLLDEYFSIDLIGFEELEKDHWKLTTFTPDSPEFYVDPKLEANLKGWVDPVSVDRISLYKRFYKNCMFSFVDSWTLFYWSLVSSFLKNETNFSIFHIDDHKDLDTPLIYREDNKDFSLLSGNSLRFSDPPTIESIVQEKAVSMGSFMSLFLHELERVPVYHLKYSHKTNLLVYDIETFYSQDKLIRIGAKRPSVRLHPGESVNEGGHSYYLSCNFEELANLANRESVALLHIDCDAFSNRFNGSSMWQRTIPSIDLNLPQMKKEIEKLFESVANRFHRIYLNIALSPGFFPSEYWKEVLDFLLARGEYFGLIQEDDFSRHLKNLYPEEVWSGFSA